MSLSEHKSEITIREKMALRILIVMYRLVSPHEHSYKTDKDLSFILTGSEESK